MSLHFNDILTFTISPAVSALSLAAAHWFPWHGGARQLRRTTAYAIGTSVVVGVPVLTMIVTWLLGVMYDQLFWAALLVVNAAVSGATVNIAYWIDGRRAVTVEDVYAEYGR